MKTEREWAEEWRIANQHPDVVSVESFVEAIQRDAWEQGFRDAEAFGRALATNRERGEHFDRVRVPIFPGDRR